MEHDDKPPDLVLNPCADRLYNRTLNDLKGNNKCILRVKELVAIYAGDPSHEPILITGERGTGKEIVSQAIYNHPLYVTHKKNFLTINCADLRGDTLGSQLFGHEKGAFTGADRKHKGILAECNGSTLVLDEFNKLHKASQDRLHRAIQNGEGLSVGGLKTFNFDVRWILACNQDPQRMCRDGELLEDLYDRIRFRIIHCPALRDHPEDIPLLVMYFIELHRPVYGIRKPVKICPSAMALLKSFDFPGNVRELEGIIKRALLLIRFCPKPVIQTEHLFEETGFAFTGNQSNSPAQNPEMKWVKDIIIRRLEENRQGWDGVAAKDVKPLFDGFCDEINEFAKLTVYIYVGSKAKAAKIMNQNLHQFDHIGDDAPEEL